MKFLITGGAGFIGSHLTDHLMAQGHHVHVLDDLSTGSLENLRHHEGHPRFDYTIGSVLDAEVLEPLVADCDRIFHLAAVVGVKLVLEQPVRTISANIGGTENVLRLADHFYKRVLLASTSEVYGKRMDHDAVTALREDDDWTLGPTHQSRWAYACSKAIDEFLAFAYHRERNLEVVLVRFFNTVGPRQTGRYGMVVPTFVKRALKGAPLPVHGDGQQTRVFLHVRDAVDAITRLIDTPAAIGHLYNIGGREACSIRALAERIVALTASPSPIECIPYEEAYGAGYEDIRHRQPDVTKLQEAIGFEPTATLDDILRDVIAHQEALAAPPA